MRIAILAAFGLQSLTHAVPLEWHAGGGYRYAALPVPATGKTGFALIPAQVTGITFTNHLSDELIARNRILENGSGVALGDVDGDGSCDVYFCRLEGANVLYRNLGNWKFEDITQSSGVACPGQFSTGAILADVEGDGDLDLLVNSIGGGTRLFLNDGAAHFTEKNDSGLAPRFGSTSMAMGDIDGDGDLELYVANYRTTTVKDGAPGLKVESKIVDGKVVLTPEDRFAAMVPKSGGVRIRELGEPDILYVNKGEGRFGPISWVGGAFVDEDGKPLTGPPRDWGMSVMFRDMNGDGTPDIYVCNDFFYSPDRVWLNEGGRRFRAIPRVALRKMSMSSMAVDFADINRDGYDDFFVADMLSRDHSARHRQRANTTLMREVNVPTHDPEFRPEAIHNMLYLNRGDGTYAEVAQFAGLEASDWTWSAVFMDVDLDGYEDLLITNGNAHDVLDADTLRETASPGKAKSAEQHLADLKKFPRIEPPNLAFRNHEGRTFSERGAEWGFNTRGISHGMAVADLDNDGDLDVVVNNLNSAAGIYRNESAAPRLAVRLKGNAPNTRGIGARIKLTGGPVRQSQEMICGGRYLSCDEAMRMFAAGPNDLSIEVTWRNGSRSVVDKAKANRIYEIDEAGAVEPIESPKPKVPESKVSGAPSSRITHHASPVFQDVSSVLNHTHHDEPFDDFARQPLLTRRLSTLGPGVAWHDLDGDGWDDLMVGSGRGGRLSVFRNNGRGGFTELAEPPFSQLVARDQTTVLGWQKAPGRAVVLAGSSNYEDELPDDMNPPPAPPRRGASFQAPVAGSLPGRGEGVGSYASVSQYDFRERIVDAAVLAHPDSSAGPLAMSDIDGDGDLDLFIGGRAIRGRYPEAAASRIYRNEGGKFRFDATGSRPFEKAGLVSGAVFSDLDLDGYAELILACDWGPVRVFRNNSGTFNDVTEEMGFAKFTGWWNGVTTGDFDGDGRLDVIASNFGRNTKCQSFLDRPIQIVYGDFAGQGRVEMIEVYFEKTLNKAVPWAALDTISQPIPFVKEKFSTYRAYSAAGLEEILGPKITAARKWSVTTLDSMLFMNRGGRFEARALPDEAQFAPAFGVAVGDYDGDGNEDVFLSENFFGVDLETSRYDGGRGLWLRGDGQGGLAPVPGQESGVKIYGEQRSCALADFDRDGRVDLVVTQNGAATKLFRNQTGRPGLRVRLKGTEANPNGVGASLRLGFASRMGPAREIHAGSGYWSQDSPVPVMATPERPTRLSIRWPGGRQTTVEIPTSAREIEAGIDGRVTKQ